MLGMEPLVSLLDGLGTVHGPVDVVPRSGDEGSGR